MKQIPLTLVVIVVLSLVNKYVYASEPIQITTGHAHVMEVQNVTDIVIGNPEVLDVQQLSNSRIIVRGIQAGASELLLLKQGREVVPLAFTVASELPLALKVKLDNLLLNDLKARWFEASGFAIVEGETSADNVDQVSQLQSEFPQVLNKLKTSEATPKSIELHVTMLAIKRSAAQRLGLQLGGTSAGPSYSRLSASPWQFPFALSSTIHMLEQSGSAELLAQPRLIAQVGETARFLAGGEIPLPQVVADGLQDIQFREYGIRLEMTP